MMSFVIVMMILLLHHQDYCTENANGVFRRLAIAVRELKEFRSYPYLTKTVFSLPVGDNCLLTFLM